LVLGDWRQIGWVIGDHADVHKRLNAEWRNGGTSGSALDFSIN
jgi:hypothetical protein